MIFVSGFLFSSVRCDNVEAFQALLRDKVVTEQETLVPETQLKDRLSQYQDQEVSRTNLLSIMLRLE